MGSYSNSNSATSYLNAPTTQEGDNPLAVTSSNGFQYGGSNNTSGSSNLGNITTGMRSTNQFTTLDGGAIQAALSLGSQSISQIAQLTKDVLAGQSASQTAALGFSDKQSAAALAAGSANANIAPNALKYAGYGVAALAVLWIFKGGFK